jgi:hypothetical protein
MAIPADWQPYHRADGLLLGWLEPSGSGVIGHDRIGRPRTDAVDPAVAIARLEEEGFPLDLPLELRISPGAPSPQYWTPVRLAADKLVDSDEIWLRTLDYRQIAPGTLAKGSPPGPLLMVLAPMPPVLREAAPAADPAVPKKRGWFRRR